MKFSSKRAELQKTMDCASKLRHPVPSNHTPMPLPLRLQRKAKNANRKLRYCVNI